MLTAHIIGLPLHDPMLINANSHVGCAVRTMRLELGKYTGFGAHGSPYGLKWQVTKDK